MRVLYFILIYFFGLFKVRHWFHRSIKSYDFFNAQLNKASLFIQQTLQCLGSDLFGKLIRSQKFHMAAMLEPKTFCKISDLPPPPLRYS